MKLGQDSPVRNSVFGRWTSKGRQSPTCSDAQRRFVRQTTSHKCVSHPQFFFCFSSPQRLDGVSMRRSGENGSKKKRCKKSISSRSTGGGKVICAPQQTCGGTANQGARCPTDLAVARLPRVAEALTLLPQGALWRFSGFPDPVGKVQSPAVSKRLSFVFFEHFHRPPIRPIFKGPCPAS